VAKLIYMMITSLDGYIADAEGSFDWAMPDEAVHTFVNDLERPIGTHLYGRRMYELMTVWETDPTLGEYADYTRDYAQIWQAADKVVFSRTLQAVLTSRTRIVREFRPAEVRRMIADAERDLSIGGAALAAEAFRAGLVDEVHLVLSPVAVGGGKPALPHGVRLDLELLDERWFGNGMVYLHYRTLK